MTTCSSDLISKGCQCLSNPIEPGSQVCAYINRQNGLVSPCDAGCCVPKCNINQDLPSILQFQNEFRASSGTALPPGVGVNLATSDAPTRTKDATEYIEPVTRYQTVWERMIIPLLMLVIVFLAIASLA
jgi:hypothetical protein